MASRPVLVGNPGVALTAEDVERVALGVAQVVRDYPFIYVMINVFFNTAKRFFVVVLINVYCRRKSCWSTDKYFFKTYV